MFVDREGLFDCDAELFFEWYGPGMLIVAEKIVDSDLCVTGGGGSGEYDISDIIWDDCIDQVLENVVKFLSFRVIGVGWFSGVITKVLQIETISCV